MLPVICVLYRVCSRTNNKRIKLQDMYYIIRWKYQQHISLSRSGIEHRKSIIYNLNMRFVTINRTLNVSFYPVCGLRLSYNEQIVSLFVCNLKQSCLVIMYMISSTSKLQELHMSKPTKLVHYVTMRNTLFTDIVSEQN